MDPNLRYRHKVKAEYLKLLEAGMRPICCFENGLIKTRWISREQENKGEGLK